VHQQPTLVEVVKVIGIVAMRIKKKHGSMVITYVWKTPERQEAQRLW
jgi:hypothetical protein